MLFVVCFLICVGYFLLEISGFLVSKLCFLSSSTHNHAESVGNYLKKSVWVTYFSRNTFFSKINLFDLQTMFFDGKNSVLQVSGRNTLETVYKITSKSKFSTHFVQFSSHLHPALSNSQSLSESSSSSFFLPESTSIFVVCGNPILLFDKECFFRQNYVVFRRLGVELVHLF